MMNLNDIELEIIHSQSLLTYLQLVLINLSFENFKHNFRMNNYSKIGISNEIFSNFKCFKNQLFRNQV